MLANKKTKFPPPGSLLVTRYDGVRLNKCDSNFVPIGGWDSHWSVETKVVKVKQHTPVMLMKAFETEVELEVAWMVAVYHDSQYWLVHGEDEHQAGERGMPFNRVFEVR